MNKLSNGTEKMDGFRIRLFILLLLVPVILTAASRPITIDGLFDDWRDVPALEDQNEFISEDFFELKAANDDNFLFIYFSYHDNEHLLQNKNSARLFIDVDNNPGTGHPARRIGAELEWCFGCRSGNYYVFDGISQIYQNDIALRSAPTITSTRFELAIRLSSWPLNLNPARGDTIRFFLQNSQASDFLPDDPGGFVYALDSTAVPPPQPIPLAKDNANHLRVLTYNTLGGGLLKAGRKESFKRILLALSPDIMAFQEQGSYDQAAGQVADWLQERSLYHRGMGNNNLVVSRFPILESAILTRSGRTMAVLLDTRREMGKKLLLLNSHLACCDNDAARQYDCDELISLLRTWRSGAGPFPLEENTPIIHLGDFNLVGDSHQLRTLATGDILDEATFGADFPPDWDGTPLIDLFSRHTAIRMGYTWRDDRSSFSPGKLDYILYSDSQLGVGNHFVLNTLAMSPQDLQAYNLEANDTAIASDHLPRIADFYPSAPSSVQSQNPGPGPENFELLPAYPNPFNSSTEIGFELNRKGQTELSIYTSTGQLVESLISGELGAGRYKLIWQAENRPSGIYLCRLRFNQQTKVIKILLQK